MIDLETFKENLKVVEDRIGVGCVRSGRLRESVTLMAVTKTHPVKAAEYAAAGGLYCVGENRVQELVSKKPHCETALQWELIGPLQSNKTRLAVEHADRIQTMDRAKIIRTADRVCEELGRSCLPVLLQVNTAEDPAKHGCSMEEASQLADLIMASPHLRLDGLMTIGELTDNEVRVRKTFVRLRKLSEQLRKTTGAALPVLSMGMTGDLEWAIEEGSTLIRVGSALYGKRY